jgi:hypothetical protein
MADPLITRLRKKSVEIVHEALPELAAYSNVVTNFTPPCVMAFPPDSIRAGQSMVNPGPGDVFDMGTVDVGRTLVTFTLRIYVSRTQGAGDQDLLDAYISPDGAKSIWQVFDRNPTLDDTCNVCQVTEVRNYGNWPIGSTTYLGVEIVLSAE